ncbi:MAG: hypothetical protein M3Q69_05755 [Acidobacteriota bacterium]|nr:hypothetical protein [Acidobacteriota bacterium]
MADLSCDTGCTTVTNEPGTNASSTCKTRIWFSRSSDGGVTWQPGGEGHDRHDGRDDRRRDSGNQFGTTTASPATATLSSPPA